MQVFSRKLDEIDCFQMLGFLCNIITGKYFPFKGGKFVETSNGKIYYPEDYKFGQKKKKSLEPEEKPKFKAFHGGRAFQTSEGKKFSPEVTRLISKKVKKVRGLEDYDHRIAIVINMIEKCWELAGSQKSFKAKEEGNLYFKEDDVVIKPYGNVRSEYKQQKYVDMLTRNPFIRTLESKYLGKIIQKKLLSSKTFQEEFSDYYVKLEEIDKKEIFEELSRFIKLREERRIEEEKKLLKKKKRKLNLN